MSLFMNEEMRRLSKAFEENEFPEFRKTTVTSEDETIQPLEQTDGNADDLVMQAKSLLKKAEALYDSSTDTHDMSKQNEISNVLEALEVLEIAITDPDDYRQYYR